MSGREGASVSLLPVPGPARGLPRRPTGQLDEWAHSTIQTEHLLCARPQAGPRPDGTPLGLLWEEGAQIKVQRQGEECWPSRKGPPVVWEGSATEGELEGTGADIRVRGTDPGARKHCQSLSRGTRRPPSFGNRSRCALTPNTLRWQLSLNPHGGIHTPPQPSGQGHSLWMPRPRSLAPPTSCSWVRLLGGPPYTA